MTQILIGVGAGTASALLFASVISGSLFSILLFNLASLPILIVALGWSHLIALIAAATAALVLAAMFGAHLFLVFLLGIGLPAWWLGYLALLARPAAGASGESLEWYPVGRLVIWAALLSACVTAAVLFSYGASEESIRAALRKGFEIVLRRPDVPSPPDLNRQIELLVSLAPPVAAISTTLINLVSLWLAGRTVQVSGRLRRPWPELSTMAFPTAIPALFAAAVAGLLLSGLIGMLSSVFAASLAVAYAILGFAVLHAITSGMSNRPLWLASAYIVVVFAPPTLLLFVLLGLADAALDIRGRFANKPTPPTVS